jgi:sugar phosphate isomerase/epimerase
VEAVASRHTVDTIDKMAALLRRLDSPRLGVVYDPVNLIPEGGVGDQAAFFREALDAFGTRIVAVHLKDFRVVDGKKRGDLPALSGELDTEALFRLLQSTGSDLDVLLENCGGDEVDAIMAKLSRYLPAANDSVMPREDNGHCC